MPDISKLTLPSGSTYNIKDTTARDQIEELRNAISGGVHYVGVTTTALTDGATTKPITINSKSYTQIKGDVVNYGSKEFIWDDAKWVEFGDLGAFKALAYKDSASGSYTPAGSVSKPTFTGTKATISVKGTPSGSVAISKGTGTANYTPEGSVSQPTFTGTSFDSTGTYKPEGSVAISVGTGTANYTPEGSVSQPTFTGTEFSSTGTYKPEGSVTISKGTGTANYTPEGSVSTPTITVTPNTGTVNSITDVGSLPSFTATVANENLTFAWSAGTLPTKGSNTTVVTGIKSATSSQPSFTGTGAELKGTFSGTSKNVTVSGTPTGSVSKPSFTGTGAELKGTFSGTSKSVSVSGTPTGTVSKPTFTGTGAELKATFTGNELTSSAEYTPAGDVSKPTFSGTAATITVS